MSADDTVRNYKSLSTVERAFRSIKSIDLKVRWHMREAWAELLFADEDKGGKPTRDPVAPAQRLEAAQTKAQTRRLADGAPARSFRTLLEELATIVRHTCRVPSSAKTLPTFVMVATPNALQRRARELLDRIAL
jgi:hypothetical protein